MMNWRGLLVVCVAVLATNSISAQANLLNAKIPEEIGMKTPEQLAADNDGPLPYGYIDDRDILWSKVVWEYIDLNEKINLPFYYPIDTASISSSRRSLFDTLLRGIKSEEISEVYDDSYFENKLTMKDIQSRLSRIDTSDAGYTLLNEGETSVPDEYIDKIDLTAGQIEGIKIKGVWYFDKRQGELKYRLLGIAPVAPDVNFMDQTDQEDLIELFWVWYPGARHVAHEMKVFNNKNSAFPLSFDHLLNARRFRASIYREENIYGNRDVAEYIKGNALFQVLEADRLKNEIRNKELDMWNY